MKQEVTDIPDVFDAQLDEFNQKVLRGARVAIETEVAELRRLKLPIIRSVNGKPFDFNPDTNPDAPPWSERLDYR
ncbi:MAG: hypothetical protein FWE67_05445 [Planctomycetaceae bacterium]|nr:hypothetical protein [Planctomycetaceae bacterium]